ncbi:MAG: cytochrome c family protein, partial [Ignavibacteriales bacterium]|nr:cytochrome c family protein [Ignavibacteriales bacterium]
MRKSFIAWSTAVFLVLSASISMAQNKYVGVKTCKMCHQTEKQGKQFDVWSKSKHAEAYKTLTTAKANEVAKAKSLTKPAAESPECLECHVVASANADKTFDMKDGVQCEACHGAGSAYKTMAAMKDKAKALAAGLVDTKDAK